ncbi:MAG: hypothetical protein R3A44_24375 [Caldilineaceae bacterium]
MTIGDRSRLAESTDSVLPLALSSGGAKHIDAACVRITFPTINTLRIMWREGSPVRQGSLIYSGAFIIVEC